MMLKLRSAGSGCEDADECASGNHDCHHVADCSNTAGGYECTCPPGYSGDGFESSTGCQDIDECESELNDCHIMAECTNTDGSFTCECIEDWSGNGFSCAQEICSICDEMASCDGTACQCPSGYSGSGFYCPKNSLVIPIKNLPESGPTCSDQYWSQISGTSENCVVLEDSDSGWDQECIKLLSENDVEIFIGMEVSSVSIAQIKDKIDNAVAAFGLDSLSGFTFSEPNTVNGFVDESFIQIFDFVKSKGLKIMLEGYNNVYDIETVNRVDSIVIFKDNFEKFSTNCVAGRSPGPFCQQSQISNEMIEDLTSGRVRNFLIKISV